MGNKIRRINLYSGPGASKSTSAAWLFSQLKIQHRKVELVQEVVKDWCYLGIKPSSFDQVFLLGAQSRKEEIVLRNGIELVVTDSPVFMSTCYAKKYGMLAWKELQAISLIFDSLYEPLDIFLSRDGIQYNKEGRYQSEQEAIEMDNFILNELEQRGRKFHRIPARANEDMLKLIVSAIGE